MIGKPKHVIEQRVPEILEYVGLGDKLNNYPDELSGEQQRVSIARACVNRPSLACRRAHGQPRSQYERRHHAAARQGEPHRYTVVMATHDQAIVDAMRSA